MQSKEFTNIKSLILFVLLLLLIAFNSFTSAQNNPNGDPLNEIGSWGFGFYRETAIDEARNLAYVNSGSVVLIIDISNVASPVLVNDLIRTNGIVNDLSYDSATQNLYVTLGDNGLEIWDVQDVNNPQHLSSLLLNYIGTTPPATKMSAKPGLIFIAAEYAGIITVNVSDPSNPYQSSFNLGTGQTKYALDLSDDGSFLVASSGHNTELFIVNPDGSINLIDEGPPLVGAEEIHIIGTYSFQVLDGTLYVLDLNSLGLPIVDSHNLLGNGTTYYGMTSFNSTLYVSDPFYGIEIFDVSNPANLTLLGSYETSCNDIKYFNGYVFTPDGTGMVIIDVSDPVNPEFVSEYEGVGHVSSDLKVSGSYCYLLTAIGLYVLDVSDPTHPVLVGVNQPSSGADLHLEIKGNYAYVTNYIEGLRAVDISDPTNPVTVDNSSPAYFNNLALDGNYIYVADDQNNLKVFDISNPASLNEVGSLSFPAPNDFTSGISALNGYAYVAQYEAGLKVIDVSNPTQPTQVATYTQNVELTHLDAEGNYVYACDLFQVSNRVDIFDISDPLNPEIIGVKTFSDPPPRAYKNFIFGDVLLVADGFDPYLTVLDVSNPSQPSQISTQMVPDQIEGVDATESYFYVATYGAGLHIYENPYGIVPVELTSFTASVSGNSVSLNWQTATETNNKGFEIERASSESLRNTPRQEVWKKIGFVNGNGTTTESKSYSFVDNNVSSGNYNYRLKQIDFDGSVKYSKEVIVNLNIPVVFSLQQNYPNPFNPTTTIEYSVPKDGFVNLTVYNILGQQVADLINKNMNAGKHQIVFNASKLASGVYYYRLESNSKVLIKKMLLLK